MGVSFNTSIGGSVQYTKNVSRLWDALSEPTLVMVSRDQAKLLRSDRTSLPNLAANQHDCSINQKMIRQR